MTFNPREPRATTMRTIANELESGSDRARRFSGITGLRGFAVWLRLWADEIDPPIETGEDD